VRPSATVEECLNHHPLMSPRPLLPWLHWPRLMTTTPGAEAPPVAQKNVSQGAIPARSTYRRSR